MWLYPSWNNVIWSWFHLVFPNSSFSVLMLFLGQLYPMVPQIGARSYMLPCSYQMGKRECLIFPVTEKKWELHSNMDSLWQVPSFVPSTVAKEMRLKWVPWAHLGLPTSGAWDRSIPTQNAGLSCSGSWVKRNQSIISDA